MKGSRIFTILFGNSLSTSLAILLALAAMLAGWILKSAVTGQTQAVKRSGISAELPVKWLVNGGFTGEALIFSSSPPLDINLSYQVHLLPLAPGGKITDLVVARNSSQAQSLPFYKVTGQQAVQLDGRNGYQVDYSYVRATARGETPEVISGRDVYLEGPEKVLLCTLEDLASHFNESLSSFNHFLRSVSYQKGGA
jgi:hypothetical protein